MNGYKALGGHISSALNSYGIFLAIRYPRLLKKDFLEKIPGIDEQMQLLNRDPDLFFLVLRMYLKRERLLPSD